VTIAQSDLCLRHNVKLHENSLYCLRDLLIFTVAFSSSRGGSLYRWEWNLDLWSTLLCQILPSSMQGCERRRQNCTFYKILEYKRPTGASLARFLLNFHDLWAVPPLIMVALWNRADIIIFLPCGFFLLLLLSSFFFSSPNLSRRRLDVCHTSTHGVALVRI